MLIRESTAPSYEKLRPMKSSTGPGFPVYPELVNTFTTTATHPDSTLAHVLATCAGYSYADADIVGAMMARMGLSDNHCLMVAEVVDAMYITSTAFLVQSADGKVLVLCYRGTQPANIINWLTVADVDPERVGFSFPGAPGSFEVHGGFYRNLRATRYEVIAALQRALEGKSVRIADGGSMPNPLEALYITGHSLGGAMAAMLALMLVTEPAYAPLVAKLKAVYTVGQPMLGTPDLADACNAHPFLGKNIIRYVYRHDVIPQLPPRAFGPFAHFGREYRYQGDRNGGNWRLADSPTNQLPNMLEFAGAPVAFLARQFPMLRALPFRASFVDHVPHHYISALTPPGVRSEFGD